MHQGEVVEPCLETVGGALAAMDRAAVDDPEDGLGGSVRFPGHHPGVEGDDGDPSDDIAEEPGTVDIPGRDVGTDAIAAVLVLDSHGAARARRRDRMAAGADRDLRLLVGADDELLPAEGAPVPRPVIGIEDASRLGPELGIAREDPAPPAPRRLRSRSQDWASVNRWFGVNPRLLGPADPVVAATRRTPLVCPDPEAEPPLEGGHLSWQGERAPEDECRHPS